MVARETLLQKLEKGARRRELEKFSQKSHKWFRNAVRAIGGKTARRELMNDAKAQNRFRDVPRPGFMYTFIYDALHKDKLPYWDSFPLIIMVGPAEGGFYGLNLHYLPPKARAALFDNLLNLASDTRYTENTKLLMTYKLLKSSSRFRLFKSCFKHYLWSQMGSRFVKIPADEWEAALFLPTANFQGASNSQVWSDTLRND